jgi:hypothetical protein
MIRYIWVISIFIVLWTGPYIIHIVGGILDKWWGFPAFITWDVLLVVLIANTIKSFSKAIQEKEGR